MKLAESIRLFHFLPKLKKTSFREQARGGLGLRLIDAFGYSKRKGFDFIIAWGSDIPSITQYDIEKTLEFHDSACLIPAFDGGYSLIAMNAKFFQNDIFEKIAWSTKKTFLMQKQRFNELGVPVHIMPAIPDLDTAKDIIKNIQYMERFLDPVYKTRCSSMSAFWNNEVKTLEKTKKKK